MRGKAAGTRVEHKVLRLLREDEWFAFRTPASLGVCDVVAMKRGQRPRMIEVKSTTDGPYKTFGPADRRELREAADRAGASAELCHWPPRRSPQFIPSEEWPDAA